ncbi:MAG: nucleotidyltransferase family protein [Pseudomonadota bacterium]
MRDASPPSACMIFAAGFGTRMKPLTDTKPKPLIEVAGKTLLRHALDPAQAAGLGPIVVNAHYLAEQIVDAVAGEDINVSIETPNVRDTGGGLKHALQHLGAGPVLTMNSDAVWNGPNPYQVLIEAWRPGEMDALLLVCPMERAHGRDDAGDFTIGSDGRPTRGPGSVYCGAQIIKPAPVAEHLEDVFSLNRIWDKSMAQGRLYTCDYPGEWCDVGRPDAIPVAEAMLHV